MADPRHVELVKDVQRLAQWRNANPSDRLDLGEADLRHAKLARACLRDAKLSAAVLTYADLDGADLCGAHLGAADLRHANLMGADLRGAYLGGADLADADLRESDLAGACLDEANLCHANLWAADLRHANLGGAVLGDANLHYADLCGADLRYANLWGADLRDAELGDANLGYASLLGTAFTNVDLSKTNGLEDTTHRGPSHVGIDTLYKSKGQIPEVFLRDCGVPDEFVAYARSLTAMAIEYYSCFISYSHEDKSFASRLHDQLQARGIRCWLDEHELLPGDDIYKEVDRGIRRWDKVILCASEHSLTSWWVDREITTAIEKEQQIYKNRGELVLAIIPLNLDGHLFKWEHGQAAELRKRMAADFTGWETGNATFEEQFEQVVKALQTERASPPESKL